MQRVFQCLLVVLAFGLSSSAAKADDWGCEVIMCLANPAGPMAASACVPPIKRLFAALSKPKPDPFPTCASANGAAAAQQGFNYFDTCPAGTTALGAGERAVQVAPAAYAQLSKAAAASGVGVYGRPVGNYSTGDLDGSHVKWGIGSGEGYGPGDAANKICVGAALGPLYLPDGNGEWLTAPAFDRVITMERASSPRYIDVMVDNKPFTRVRF